ncbi:MAG: UDP-2,3-diacylglucosamine diphosphatase [Fimbriimonadaceae bacterium]|nr:UDP-2,3-diacylglucosamine diphosphatase [Fimbriimonadaceae bacterium]
MSVPVLNFRSIFLSDTHLGSAACKVEDLIELLKTVHCENLYLVGDIFDVWVMVKRGKWKQEHTNVVKMILGKTNHNCTVYYTPGNHDAFLRRMNELTFGRVHLDDSFVHRTVDGRSLLVIHGDQFDSSVKSFALSFVGTWFYEIITLARLAAQAKGRRGPDSSGRIKKGFKRVINAVGRFDEKLALAAQNEDCDGVVCGHIHRPEIRVIDGTKYINTGDWVEHRTLVVEHFDGRLELLTLDDIRRMAAEAPGLTRSLIEGDPPSEVR